MQWVLIIILIFSGLLILGTAGHLVLTWANRKGWVYYRNEDRPTPHSLGLLEEIYQPSIEHVIDEQVSEQTTAEQTESGDPEVPGSTG